MARMPNYTYLGHGMGLGQGLSNLGQALFGDPAEIRAQQNADVENQYRQSLIADHEQTRALEKSKMDRQAKLADEIMAMLGGNQSGATPTPANDMAQPVPAPMTAAGTALPPAPGFPMAMSGTENPAQIDPASLANIFQGDPGVTPLPPEMVAADRSPIMAQPLPPLHSQSAMVGKDDAADPASLAALFADVAPANYPDVIAARESGGRADAQNPIPGQSASGLYGYIDKTWQGLGGEGHARDATPEMQRDVLARETGMHADIYRDKMGADPSGEQLGVMHQLGAGMAMKVLQMPPNTPLAQVLGPDIIRVNPQLANMTTGQLIDEYKQALMAGAPMGADMAPKQVNKLAEPNSMVGLFDQPAPEQGPALTMPPPTMAGPGAPASPAAAPVAAAQNGPQGPLQALMARLSEPQKAAIMLSIQSGADPAQVLIQLATKMGDEGSGGPFGGSGLATSLMNEMWAIEQKKASGEELTDEDRRTYNMAKNYLAQAKMQLTPSGEQVISGRDIGTMDIPLPGAAQTAAPGAPAAPADPNAPASTSVGGLTITQAGTGAKPLTPEIAGSLSMLNEAEKSVIAAANILAPKDKTGKRIGSREDVAKAQAGVPWTAGREAGQQLLTGIGQAVYAASGKATTEQEFERFERQYMPSLFDRDSGAYKFDKLQELLRLMRSNLEAGRHMTLDEIGQAITDVPAAGDPGAGGGAAPGVINYVLDPATGDYVPAGGQ